MDQGVGPEFKPQYRKQTKTKTWTLDSRTLSCMCENGKMRPVETILIGGER
jgi:hypothetical protein